MRQAPPPRALLALLLLGCSDPPPPPPPPPVPPPPAPIVAGRAVTSATAFALVPVPDGALLIYGVPYREGGGLRVLRLGPGGEALESDRPIARTGAAAGGTAEQHVSQAVEVDAFASGGRVSVAWVMDFGHLLRTQWSFSVDGGRRFSRVEDGGETVRIDPDVGGRLAMSDDGEGHPVLQHRILDGPCASSRGRCARLRRRAVEGRGPSGGAGDLEVRTPCDPLISGPLSHDGSVYYLLCHADGEAGPSTAVTTLRLRLSWAASTSLDGCRPEAIAPLDRGVVVITTCGEERVATRLDDMGRVTDTYRPVERVTECEEGRPVLRVRQGRRQGKLRLAGAIDHLEGLLPSDVAPPGSRAIWTGQALLVATPQGHELRLHRYECREDGRFDRTDVR